jgi:nucleoside-diphosphate-sugar epimerase
MDGQDIFDKREDQLPDPMSFSQLQEYARTKALGEQYALSQNSDDFLVCAIGPHQVYGPMDRLFLPAFMETAANGRLRVLGTGQNLISFTHTDNCAHAHILAAKKMTKASVAPAGKYYIVTDGGAQYMWHALDQAVVSAGFTSLLDKFNVNTCLLFPISYICLAISRVTGITIKLNPFVVKMVSMNRYFNIDNLSRDVGYAPIRSFAEAWPETCEIVLTRMGLSYTKYVKRAVGRASTAADAPDANDDGHGPVTKSKKM